MRLQATALRGCFRSVVIPVEIDLIGEASQKTGELLALSGRWVIESDKRTVLLMPCDDRE